MLLLFRIAENDLHTTFPASTSATCVISVLKAIILPLQEEQWRVFSLKQQTFSPGGLPYWGGVKNMCYNNNTGFNTKIHTCALNIFLLLGKICCIVGSKETYLKVGTLQCVTASGGIGVMGWGLLVVGESDGVARRRNLPRKVFALFSQSKFEPSPIKNSRIRPCSTWCSQLSWQKFISEPYERNISEQTYILLKIAAQMLAFKSIQNSPWEKVSEINERFFYVKSIILKMYGKEVKNH